MVRERPTGAAGQQSARITRHRRDDVDGAWIQHGHGAEILGQPAPALSADPTRDVGIDARTRSDSELIYVTSELIYVTSELIYATRRVRSQGRAL